MNNQIRESDWKVYKELYPRALERYYERAITEFREVLAKENVKPEDQYHEIYKLVQNRDEKVADLFDNAYRRSVAFSHLIMFYRESLITREELNQLSEENRDRILAIVEES